MNAELQALVREAQATGRISGLPGEHFIDGRFTPSAHGARMETFDPGTGQAFSSFAAGDADDVDGAVRASQAAMRGPWRALAPTQRGRARCRVQRSRAGSSRE